MQTIYLPLHPYTGSWGYLFHEIPSSPIPLHVGAWVPKGGNKLRKTVEKTEYILCLLYVYRRQKGEDMHETHMQKILFYDYNIEYKCDIKFGFDIPCRTT